MFCDLGKLVKLYSEIWMLNLSESVEPIWCNRVAGLSSTLKSTRIACLASL